MAYPNGEVPLSKLVHLGANFWLPPGTAARWLWFVAEGKRRFNVTFRITPDRDGLGGWNAYRPLSAQILYRKHYGNMAAVARYSSHGGFYQGQEVFAIDVDNWASVPWSDFVALCREAGFRTNFVVPTERWHIGDFNDPWTAPAFTGGSSTPEIPKPIIPEDDEMYLYKQVQGELVAYILWIPGRAKYQVTRDVNQANRWAVLVGKDAKLISDEAVGELINISGLFT